MKQLIDFIPLIIFFVLYKTHDIYVATMALIVAIPFQIAFMWWKYRKVEKMHLITFAMVAVFGGLTIYLQDEDFIKWKVTIVYALFAVVLLGSQLMGKPVVKAMLGKEITLPEFVWRNLNLAWTGFFSICAVLNVYIAFHLPTDVWVNFKVFGLLIATFVFTILSGVYMFKYMPKEEEPKTPESE
ncbi:putative intracellular septation protein A [Vibrio stylophorae]|uniref:Inner membrane-spanning protein YciB n=1 Tax=Vibrio stylophorae TaxID=659351 RepID=A0ABM8ZRV5_9VIBR|nr:septation protein A [Vibrio stylophorae]CAH0532976.1 putative intracellular septation protein A [Vibrio stylophorae]